MSRAARLSVIQGQDVCVGPTIPAKIVRALLKWSIIAIVTAIAVVWASLHIASFWEEIKIKASEAKELALSRVTRVEVKRELVKADAVPMGQLVRVVSKRHRVPTVVLKAIIEQESADGKFLYRFEPDKYTQLKMKERLPESEVRMLASSHGLAHVMGFNAEPRCGVHWSKLYDSLIGLECGARILRENMDRHQSVKDSSRRIWLALRDYNGSGKRAEEYADEVMSRIGRLLLRGVDEEAL